MNPAASNAEDAQSPPHKPVNTHETMPIAAEQITAMTRAVRSRDDRPETPEASSSA